ncbi:MAG: hypothetical protein QW478_10000 [Candidatus Micrarchaeaceae archaeon]
METENKERVILEVKMFDKDGNLVADDIQEKDLVVNAGLALRAALLGDVSSPVALNAIAVGTGTTTPAATDTALGNEVARVASTNSVVTTNVTNDTLEMVGSITFSASYAISEVGTFNSTTAKSGTMYSHDLTGPYNVTSGTTLQFTFKFVQTS